jgi:UDP-3-O-[3-hydroxymyristoyl] glucosamine N-acyltransferase
VAQRRRLRELVERLGDAEIIGDDSLEVSRAASLSGADAESISFLHRADYQDQLKTTAAAAVVLAPAHVGLTDITRVVTANPYAWFARLATELHPPRVAPVGIHPSAVIDPAAVIGQGVRIGALVHVAAGARIGDRASIGAGCIIGEEATIGADTLLHAQVTVYHAVSIGARCILHSGTVIGSDGFGFAPQDGRWIKIPQIGRVRIGDDVEIGANCAVDRGALDDTVIEEGVKLDNLVQIAHNVRIGAHTVIAGNTGVAGSTTVGDHCIIGGASTLAGHLTIVAGTTIAGGTTITRSIAQPDTYVGVFPSDRRGEWLRNSAHLRSLDALARRVKRLEKASEESIVKDET